MEVNDIVKVRWEMGLHIRPATQIVKLLKTFSSEVRFRKDGATCNGKSLIQLLTLEAGKGDQIEVVASGEDAELAVNSVKHFFVTYIDEYDQNQSGGIGIPL